MYKIDVVELHNIITKTLQGQGNLKVNKSIYDCCKVLEGYGYEQNDLQNGIFVYVLEKELLDKYDESKSLAGYITTIVYYYLLNKVDKCIRSKEADYVASDLVLYDSDGVDTDFMSLQDSDAFGNQSRSPDDDYCYRMLLDIVYEYLDDVDLQVCYGELSRVSAAVMTDTSYENYSRQLLRRKQRLLVRLHEEGCFKDLETLPDL